MFNSDLKFVMAGHSRPEGQRALHAYVPAISLRDAQLCKY